MSRERMVTRTITTTRYEVLCVDTSTAQTLFKEFERTGEIIDNDDKELSLLKKDYETETLKLVQINNKAVSEILYGLSEVDFVRVAHVLNDKRKPIDEETEEE